MLNYAVCTIVILAFWSLCLSSYGCWSSICGITFWFVVLSFLILVFFNPMVCLFTYLISSIIYFQQ